MIWQSSNVKTHDDAEVLLLGTSSFNDGKLDIEIRVQYLDEAKTLFSKTIKTHLEPDKDDIAVKFDNQFNKCIKRIENKTLMILFGWLDI